MILRFTVKKVIVFGFSFFVTSTLLLCAFVAKHQSNKSANLEQLMQIKSIAQTEAIAPYYLVGTVRYPGFTVQYNLDGNLDSDPYYSKFQSSFIADLSASQSFYDFGSVKFSLRRVNGQVWAVLSTTGAGSSSVLVYNLDAEKSKDPTSGEELGIAAAQAFRTAFSKHENRQI